MHALESTALVDVYSIFHHESFDSIVKNPRKGISQKRNRFIEKEKMQSKKTNEDERQTRLVAAGRSSGGGERMMMHVHLLTWSVGWSQLEKRYTMYLSSLTIYWWKLVCLHLVWTRHRDIHQPKQRIDRVSWMIGSPTSLATSSGIRIGNVDDFSSIGLTKIEEERAIKR